MAQIPRTYERHVHRSSSCSSVRISRSAPELSQGKEDSDYSSATTPTLGCERGSGDLGKVDDDTTLYLQPDPDAGILGIETLIATLDVDHALASPDLLTSPDKYHDFLGLEPEHWNQPSSKHRKPFQKWVQILHRRRLERQWAPHQLTSTKQQSARDDTYLSVPSTGRRLSSSVSSFAFVANAREASLSLASTSIKDTSQRRALRSSWSQSHADRGSRCSAYGRLSEDSHYQDKPSQIDPAIMERALHRRHVLEELIKTEEGYIGDVRFLMNAYLTILASLPTLKAGLRSAINRNLTDIVELHESLLSELHKAVPDSEHSHIELPVKEPTPTPRRNPKWRRSLGAVSEYDTGILDTDLGGQARCPGPTVEPKGDMPRVQGVPGIPSDPEVAARVARVFIKKMNRFFIYEEYGAQYELMFKDLYAAYQSISNWDAYQKGLETLGSCIGSTNQSQNSRKALTIGDLLTKPIQRVCRYPLLFSELLKYTPVCDCPYAYMEIENALSRMREVTGAMNRATDNVLVRATLEKTWLLQDRLVFPNQQLDALSKGRIRSLGHIQLCGVLHICWQTRDSVKGGYMVCLLYRDWLCLAIADKSTQTYTLQACLPLCSCNLEEADNGRGLQCHTAPFSWKLVFECDYQLYEIVMTACSPREEWEWRRRLDQNAADEECTLPEIQDFSFLVLNIKTLGTVFGKPGTTARRLSIRRATTVGSKSPLCQVIVKNTSVDREGLGMSSKQAAINRSQSLQTSARVPVLAPSRGDRTRLEALVSDVWTRDVLPFPGITIRARGERLALSSASSAMRKLSMASLTSTFSRRSTARGGVPKSMDVDTDGTEGLVSSGQSPSNTDLAENNVKVSEAAAEAEAEAETQQKMDVDMDPPWDVPWISVESRGFSMRKRKTQSSGHSHVSRNETSESSTMTGSIRRTVARLFEDSWQHQSGDKRSDWNWTRKSSHGGHFSSSSVLRSESYSYMPSSGSPDVMQVDPPLEEVSGCVPEQAVRYPMIRKPSSIRSLKQWSKEAVFHRGALGQSFRSLLH